MSGGITIKIKAATGDAAAQLERFFGQITGALNQLTQAGEFVRGLAVQTAAAFTLGAVVEEFKKAIDSAEEFGKTMQKTGLALQTLSEAKLLGVQKGLQFDQLSVSLELFNQKLFMAQTLGGPAADEFFRLGIAQNAAELATLNTDTALRRVMDAIAAMPDGIQKSGAAFEFFGRTGREMIPFLNAGSEGLDRLHDAAAAAIDQQTIDNATHFNASMRELDDAFHQIFLDASRDLLPILQDLVAWLKSTETSMNGEVTASEGLVVAFKAVATGVVAVKSGLVVLFQFIGDVAANGLQVLQQMLGTVVDQFAIWWDWIKKISTSLKDLVMDVGHAAAALERFLNPFQSGGKEALSDSLKRMGSDFKKIGADTADTWRQSGDSIVDHLFRAGDAMQAIGQQFLDSATDQAQTYVNAISPLWSKPAPTKTGAGAGGTATPAAASLVGTAPAAGSAAPLISDEGKKLVAEVDKAWREATQTKLQILDNERAELLKKLDLEVADVNVVAQKKLEIEQLYAAKRADLQRKAQQEQFQLASGGIGLQAKAIQDDPLTTQLEKARQLVPLFQQLAALNAQMAQQNLAVEQDPRASEEAKLAAQKDQLKIAAQQLEIQTKLAALQREGSFTGNLQTGMTKLEDEWGNLGKNSAATALDAIKEGVHGVGTAIMDSLEKTKSWGQVFLQVGRQIVSQIIDMAVQWIVQATLIQGLKEAFAIADKATAAETTAAQAPAALMTSLATSGSSVALGLAAFLAAAATAVGFDSGGVIGGGEQLIRVNEGGQTEAVLNAGAVSYLGHDFINSVNAGAQSNAGLHSAVLAGLNKPITSTGGLGAGGGTTVQGHKMSVAFVNSRSEARDYLNSSEGEKHIVDIGRRRRLDLGVQT